ncbi:right-handed parallel beta-helix repeat-containing protein [Chengkuizengella marina]|uniref:Right handed beta helix domain-containing protein n=1 Tax=Chengkuizengella marina TaxID=2507566 RepID=A0A6N9PYH7_9BACL|nr:right-handed parallel beta-helix repeat-containing protein [Chengkuizengella marina]NBI27483.1 hypothetical protein [Chengkuizengella marina]
MTVRKVPTSEFPTINDALADSKPYDTIRVGEGNFPESLTIDIEGLRIIGVGKGKTIIEGEGAGTSGITINSFLVTIEDLTVQNFNSGSGIEINDDLNIIHKVQILNNGRHGIDISDSSNIVIQCESNENGENGINIDNSFNLILHCKIIGNRSHGIFIESEVLNLIHCCLAQKNIQDGFHNEGNFSYIISSVAIKNGGNGFSDGSFSSNNFYGFNKSIENKGNGFVIDVEVLVFDNVSKNNGLNGILVMDDGARIIKNVIANNKENGIRVEDFENVIDRNIIKNNGLAGIRIAGDETAFRSNCLKGNSPDIFVEDMVEDCTFADNDCETSMPLGLCERNDAIDVQEGESIQQAIDDAPDGFQINIGVGVFNEPIYVEQERLRIVGADMCKTIIDGTNIEGDGIFINNFLNSIENLTVQNFGSNGVVIDGESNSIDRVISKNNKQDGFIITRSGIDLTFFNECKATMNKENGFNGFDSNLNYFIRCNANKNRNNGFLIEDGNLLLFNEAKENSMNGFVLDDSNLCIGNCALRNKGNGYFTIEEVNFLFRNKVIGNSLNGIISADTDNIIWGNICNKNEGDGIEINEEDNVVVLNICQLNKGNGIQVNETSDLDSIIDHNCIENNQEAGIIIEETDADFFGIRSNCLSGNILDIQNNSLEVENIAIDENKCNSSKPDGLCEGSCDKSFLRGNKEFNGT